MAINDIEVASMTQTPEEVQRILADSGYSDMETSVISARPAGDEAENPTPTKSTVPTEAPGETAVATDDETGADSEAAHTSEQEKQPKKEGGFKRKLAQTQAERDRYREETERLKKQLEDLSSVKPESKTETKPETEAAPKPITPAADDASPEPQFDDFADEDNQFAAYAKAFTEWKINESKRQERVAARTEQETKTAEDLRKKAEAEQQEFTTRWNAQIDEAKAEYDDFDEVINNPEAKASPAMKIALQDSDRGAKLAYWLGTHLEESARIAELTLIPEGASQTLVRQKMKLAYRELDRIEAMLDTAPSAAPAASREARPPAQAQATPVPATTTPAPKLPPTPPSTVGSRGTPSRRHPVQMTADELRNMDPADWRKAREAV